MPAGIRQQAQWVPGGDPENVNSPLNFGTSATVPLGQLGRYLITKQPASGSPISTSDQGRDKEYRFVKTDSTMAVAPYRGAVALWSDHSSYLTTTSQTKTGKGRVAGVYKNSVTPGNYCFVQTGGPSVVKFIDGVTQANLTVAGNFVIPSAGTDGKADVVALGTAPTQVVFGYTAGAMNLGDNTALVDLSVPDIP